MSETGRFLARWSRLKKAATDPLTAPLETSPDPETLLAGLGPDSDFAQFLRQEISEDIRRKAMKSLFADPHFNVMDGLDIYIDDYSISEPIPEAMLATLNQARGLFDAPTGETSPVATPNEDCDILAAEGQNVPPPMPRTGASTENQ